MWNSQILTVFSDSWVIRKYVRKMAKIRLRAKCYNFTINKHICIAFYKTFSWQVTLLRENARIFQRNWEINNQIASWSGRAGLGRVGPGRLITDIVSTYINIFFVLWTMCLKSILSNKLCCCEVPCVTAERYSWLRARCA